MKTRKSVAKILLTMGLGWGVPGLRAQETRKPLSSPTPTYPETARQFRLSGVVKVQAVTAPRRPNQGGQSHRRPSSPDEPISGRAEELESMRRERRDDGDPGVQA